MHANVFLCGVMLVVFAFSSPMTSLADDIENNNSKINLLPSDPVNGSLNQLIKDRLQKLTQSWQQPKASSANTKPRKPSAMSSEKDTHGEETVRSNTGPVYMPPIRGAPVGRVAGGSRGIPGEYPSLLCVISPNHTAMTIHNQPDLYWFLREITVHPVEFTIIEEQAIYPLLETRMHHPSYPGIQKIQVADYGIALKQNVTYKWFVSIVPDPDRRSKDILAWGAIRYIPIPDNLNKMLSQQNQEAMVGVYAQAGLWYDAFANISDLIQSNPNDPSLIEIRKSLLEQIGLSQILQR